MFDCWKGRGSSETKDTLGKVRPVTLGHRQELQDLLLLHKPLGPCFIESAKTTLNSRQSEANAQTKAQQHVASMAELSGNKNASASVITDTFCMFVCIL